MKKIIAILIVSLILMPTVCAFAEKAALGGWGVADSAEISEENMAVWEKATDGLVGVNYEPIAYLGQQVVAGLNHCFLAKATVVYPNAEPALVLVYIYQDLTGGAEITNIADLDIAALSVRSEPAAEE